MLQDRDDLLEVTIWTGDNDSTIKILMAPEDWDKLFNEQFSWIDETNEERAISVINPWV